MTDQIDIVQNHETGTAIVRIGAVVFNNCRIMSYSLHRELDPQYRSGDYCLRGFLQVGSHTKIQFETEGGVVITAESYDNCPREV